jgi:hypothetical protein
MILQTKSKVCGGSETRLRKEPTNLKRMVRTKHGDKVQLKVDLHLARDSLNKAALAQSTAEKEKKQIEAQNAELGEKYRTATEDLQKARAYNDELSTMVSTLTKDCEATKTFLAEAKAIIDQMGNEKNQKGIDVQSVPQDLSLVGESIISGQADLHAGEHQSHSDRPAVRTSIDSQQCSSMDGAVQAPEACEDTDVAGKVKDGMSNDRVSTDTDTQVDKATSTETGSTTEVNDIFAASLLDNKDAEDCLAQEEYSEVATGDSLFRVDTDIDIVVEDEGTGEEAEEKELEWGTDAELGINAAIAQQSEAEMLFADHQDNSDTNETVRKAAPW